MRLSNLLARLWAASAWQTAVEQTATQAIDTVWSKLSSDVHQMSAAQRYGYVRAHATATVARLSRQVVSRGLVAHQRGGQTFEQAVLECVVGLTLVRLSRPALPAVAPARRAA